MDAGLSKFNPAIHPINYIDLSREGKSAVEIAALFNVSINTLNVWAETHQTFNTAYEIGKALHEAWWLKKGKGGLRDRFFNTSLFKFLTGNTIGYSEKQETKNFNVNAHGVLAVPSKVSIDEWEQQNILDVESKEVGE